jgi:predicted dinucleotide-binding enzyme
MGISDPKTVTGTCADTARFGELIVLAVKGAAAREAICWLGERDLAGKVVIDTTDPICRSASGQ